MVDSLYRLVFGDETVPAANIRPIENSYHVEMVSQNQQQLVAFHASAFRLRAREASAHLLGPASKTVDQGGKTVRPALPPDVAGLFRAVDDLTDVEDADLRTPMDALESVQRLSETVEHGLHLLAEQTLLQRVALERIASDLQNPYEARALELRRAADVWLERGMKDAGEGRDDCFDDAMRLLRAAVDNPIGMQDYVAWFHLGWLLWKHERDIPAAEAAFARAARLSAPARDLYYTHSIRHLAYMQYLRENFQAAYDTIHKALDPRGGEAAIDPDHETMFDAARYAAKTGREPEALEWLEKCIRQRPSTIVDMFAEEDFR